MLIAGLAHRSYGLLSFMAAVTIDSRRTVEFKFIV